MKHKGIICGILAAVCYGTNPFGALPLYEEGVNTASVLFYRFSTAVIMLATMLLAERKSFRINGSELKTLGSLGLLFAASSITYFQSFHFMDAGIASTILFVYPVMLPPSPRAWFFACWLGLVPTVLSLVFMTIAVHEVGATPTAIMGALEPLTAVAIGVTVFGESLTLRLFAGIVLILSAVLLIVLGKNFHLRTIGHTITSIVRKTWRWKS